MRSDDVLALASKNARKFLSQRSISPYEDVRANDSRGLNEARSRSSVIWNLGRGGNQ
ncbi:hypothetical protein BH10PLA2_BH10PLA2_31740 [soil metagenome]